MEVYRIRDWDKNFANSKSRQVKNLAWIPIPIKQDGYSFLKLLSHEHGAAYYGVWMLLVQHGAKCEPRGTLLRNSGEPHTIETLSTILRIKPDLLSDALSVLSGKEIAWIEVVDDKELTSTALLSDGLGPRSDAPGPDGDGLGPLQDKTRQDTREQERTRQDTPGSDGLGEISAGEGRRGELELEWKRIRKIVHPKQGKFWKDDRQLLFKIATLRVLGYIPDDVIEETLEAVAKKKPESEVKFFKGGVMARARTAGLDPDDLLGRVVIPGWAVNLVDGTERTVV